MWESVTDADDFEVYQAVVNERNEIISQNKVLGNIFDFDFNKLRSIHWSCQAEVFNVKACKFGAMAGYHTVDNEIDQLELCGGGCHFTRIYDPITSNCYSSAVGILFLWAHLTHHFGVRHFLSAVLWDITMFDNLKRFSSRNSLYLMSVSIH